MSQLLNVDDYDYDPVDDGTSLSDDLPENKIYPKNDIQSKQYVFFIKYILLMKFACFIDKLITEVEPTALLIDDYDDDDQYNDPIDDDSAALRDNFPENKIYPKDESEGK